MQDDFQSRPSNSMNENVRYGDEIDLVDLVAVLWRQRWFMLVVFGLCLAAAVLYCAIAPAKHEIIAQIAPGITGFNDRDQPVYAFSAKDIQSWFEHESYQDQLLQILDEKEDLPEIKVQTNREAKVSTVSFLWPDPAQGKELMRSVVEFLSTSGTESLKADINISKEILNREIFKLNNEREQILIERDRLADEMLKITKKSEVEKRALEQDIHASEKDLELIEIEKAKIENESAKQKSKIKVLNVEIDTIKKNQKDTNNLISQIGKQIDKINKDTNELMELRQEMISGESDKFALLMYSNIVQQNIGYVTTLQQRLSDLDEELNRYTVQQALKNKEIQDLMLEIQELETKKDEELAINKAKLEKNLLTLNAELVQKIEDTKIATEELKVKKNKELDFKNGQTIKDSRAIEAKIASLAPVEIIQPPFNSHKPVEPKKIKIVAIALVFGGFSAVIFAFMREFWQRNREKVTRPG